jgi:hypothetical protein
MDSLYPESPHLVVNGKIKEDSSILRKQGYLQLLLTDIIFTMGKQSSGYHKNLYKESTVMPKKVLIALPPAMLEQADHVAHCEHRTRSDLIREALRRYLHNFKIENQAPLSQLVSAPPSD